METVGSARDRQEVNKITADQSESQKEIYAYLLNIRTLPDGRYTMLVGLKDNSFYTFKDGKNTAEIYLEGSDTEVRTVPNISNYWSYRVKMFIPTNLAHSKVVQAKTAQLVYFKDFSGRDLGDKEDQPKGFKLWKTTFTRPEPTKEELVARDADLIQHMVDSRNNYIDRHRINAPKSYPDPKSPSGSLYKHKISFSPLQNIKRDVQEIKHGMYDIGPSGIMNRVRNAQDFYQKFPGGEINGDNVNRKDRNGNLIVSESKVTMKSYWTSGDFRNASWDRISAQGRRFSPLLKESPSSIIKPLKTWISAIGDIETLAISSLIAILSIITLGDFKPSNKKK